MRGCIAKKQENKYSEERKRDERWTGIINQLLGRALRISGRIGRCSLSCFPITANTRLADNSATLGKFQVIFTAHAGHGV